MRPVRAVDLSELGAAIERVAAETQFSGVVRVDRAGAVLFEQAYGLAHRAHRVANRLDTQFAIASGVKGLTAMAVVSLVEDGTLQLSTTARSVLGSDLPLIADDVTVEHLLAHRSGIGDYIDEDADHEITDYVMGVPVHQLVTTEDYLAVLGGYPQKFAAGEQFAYCNGGFVVLALIAERASGVPFHDLIEQRVCRPAGMVDTAFLRSDELPGRAATGYLAAGDAPRSNIHHLPVCGSGDGGIYTTAADVHAMWAAFFAGRIVSKERVAEMVRPHSDAPEHAKRYGLGVWLHETSDAVILEGYDAGVSFRSTHVPSSAVTFTVIANWTDGAWPVTHRIAETLHET